MLLILYYTQFFIPSFYSTFLHLIPAFNLFHFSFARSPSHYIVVFGEIHKCEKRSTQSMTCRQNLQNCTCKCAMVFYFLVKTYCIIVLKIKTLHVSLCFEKHLMKHLMSHYVLKNTWWVPVTRIFYMAYQLTFNTNRVQSTPDSLQVK